MSDRTLTRLGHSVAIVTLILGGMAAIILVTTVPFDRVSTGQIQALSGTLIVPVLVLIVLPQVPRNGSIWAFAVTGAALALSILGDAVALSISDLSSADITNSIVANAEPILTAPADLPLASSIGLVLSMTMWIPSFLLIPTTVLLLFPDGRYPRRERRWRWIGILTAITLAVGITSLMWEHRPSRTLGYTAIEKSTQSTATVAGIVAGVAASVAILLVVASIIGFIVKWRQSAGEQRVQYRWVGFVFLVFAIWQVVTVVFGGIIDSTILDFVSWTNIIAIVVAYAVAITKYRLYDIDLVVSRTLVYGVLVGLIAVVYAAIVAVPLLVLGESEGADAQPAPLLAIAATAVIAIAFQPARRWLEQAVNRIVYGKRATPYEVLSEFSQRVAATDDDLLDMVPESLVAGTSAERAAVWVRTGPIWTRTTAFPPGTESEPFPGFTASGSGLVSVPVEHDGEVMGAVTLAAPQSQRLSLEDERLAHQVASGMGLALRNQRLTDDLQRRVDELRYSRRRIVSVQDDTRRSLERDLHDGAQQQLVAVKVKLGIARQMASRDAAATTAATLETIARDADGAIDEMRTFARGIYPPLLEAEGLVPAITAHARRLPITVDITHHGLGRYDHNIESTIYLCVVEALDNITNHTTATIATVDLTGESSELRFTITNPPPGYDPTTTPKGTGHTMMTDRLDVLAGHLTIHSTPEGPTTVTCWAPAEPTVHLTESGPQVPV